MTDIFIPPWLNVARVGFSPVESVGVSQSPFGGFPRTATLASGRMRATVDFSPAGGSQTQSERGTLMATLANAGRANRVIFGNPAFRLRGSFPAVEVLSNNTFASGTTGWNNAGSPCTLAVADRVMRVTRTATTPDAQLRQSATVTAFAPYASRAFVLAGRGSPSLFAAAETSGASSQSPGPGMATSVLLSSGTTMDAIAYDAGSGGLAGDFFETPYVSLSRCALVDAGVNLMTNSEDFSNASWSKSEVTVSANATTAPNGASTADGILETVTNSAHHIDESFTVPSANADFTFGCAVKAAGRSWCQMTASDGANFVRCWFDLANGLVGSTTTSAGTFTTPRGFIAALGNGWYQCSMVYRKANSSTSITHQLFTARSDSDISYAGTAAIAIYAWRGTTSQSSVGARLVSNAAAASTGELQLGGGLYLKGLPASTTGLLLPGDFVEVVSARGGELKVVTKRLDSNSAGLGYLQFSPSMRYSPADNAAVIIQQPMGRFISLSEAESWSTDPGMITSASADFIEA